MSDSPYIAVDFNRERLILHVHYMRRIHLNTPEQAHAHFRKFHAALSPFLASGRFYLIINMSNLIIEPELTSVYARHAREVQDMYIKPNGIARYGFQITRVTVRRGYKEYLGECPNIFNTRDEAYNYIKVLIDNAQASSSPSPA